MTSESATVQGQHKGVLDTLNPLVSKWLARFESLTPPQMLAIPLIQEGKNVLIASPTGSGKTLAAFLSIISELINLSQKGEIKEQVYCIYISPLRALSNDIKKNLLLPLEEIDKIAKEQDIQPPNIRVATRTGDTAQSERARMLKHPPHILITTPESLSIMITAPKFKEKLRSVRWVIVDEIHEICESKRGVHLSLTLERLENLCDIPPARIGLSATIHPLPEVARYLVGYSNGKERECSIVDTRFVKKTEFLVSSPVRDLIGTESSRITDKMYDQIKELIRRYRTSLVFTNTRSGTERVVYHLAKLNAVNLEELAAHHSSLSREIRLDVEDRLKQGRMKVVVTSTSLELGIDIGSIDLVVQIGSPKSISRCLQRIGRSGHSLQNTSRGVLIGLERDDLVEDMVIVREALKGRLDRVHIPKGSLDVLAQHIVGMALEKKWNTEEAFHLIRRSYCYKDLDYETFERVLKYLSGAYSTLEGYKVYGKIWYDANEKVFGKRGKLMRVIYSTNIGTIPDEVAVKVYDEKNRPVGSIEEEFLERLSKGDIFTLGGRLFMFRRAKGFKAYVSRIRDGKPTVPSWFSEMLPLSFDLGEAIGDFRNQVFELVRMKKRKDVILDFIMSTTHADTNAAEAVIGYFDAEMRFLRQIGIDQTPDNKNIIVENYIDKEGRQNIIFNCVFGRRVHDALSRAYAQVISERLGRNVLVTVQDSCFSLTLEPGIRYDINSLLADVNAKNIREKLIESIKHTEMTKRRFRHCATRALMVLRNYKGHEIRLSKQQINSQILLSVSEKLDKFPIVEETYREIVEDMMDVEQAASVLKDVERGVRRFIVTKELDLPSPFTHELLVSGYTDVVLMEDRRALLNALYQTVMRRIGKGHARSHHKAG
ncbi:MAG: ATP-dependent helicase [Conexivisphaerales archaeon]